MTTLELTSAFDATLLPYGVTPISPNDLGGLFSVLSEPRLWTRWRYREAPLPSFENFSTYVSRNTYQQWVFRSRAEPGTPFGIFTAFDADTRNGTAQISAGQLGDASNTMFAACAVLAVTRLFETTHLRQVYVTMSPVFSDPTLLDLMQTSRQVTFAGRLDGYESVHGSSSDLDVYVIRRDRWLAAMRPLGALDQRSSAAVVVPTSAAILGDLRDLVSFADPVDVEAPLQGQVAVPAMLGAVDLYLRRRGWLTLDDDVDLLTMSHVLRRATEASVARTFDHGRVGAR